MRLVLALTGAILSFAAPAHAVVCSGTTMPVGSSGTATAAFLLGTGNCVAVSDKIFGEFAASGAITGDGSASFTFSMSPGTVTLGFSGVVGPSTVGTINYAVAVDPTKSQGFLIDDLEKDFTFNAQIPGLPASATLTGTVNPGAIAYNCNRTIPAGGTCPETHIFAPVTQISVSETITTGANAIVTALTDTISQVPPGVGEPGTLAVLGSALLIMGFARRLRL